VPDESCYQVSNGDILKNNERIVLMGVNVFGFETENHIIHGLWIRNYEDMLDQMQSLGFNAVRLPICPQTLDGAAVSSIDYYANPELQGLNALECLDVIVNAINDRGMYLLLDHHRLNDSFISELWYADDYPEQNWVDDLVFLADRYSDLEYFMGIDLKNEPHGAATWGTGNAATDWNAAAERAAKQVLAVNSNILIFVEGIADNPVCSSGINHWWGGNLEPQACYPLDIPDNKLVFTPHIYGPDVWPQPYFDAADFPNNMPAIWDTHFGYLADQGRVLAPGEIGGKYGHGGVAADVVWQDALIDYFIAKRIHHFFYWSWNPNSSDTGGILKDDWTSIWEDKVINLQRLMDAAEGLE